MMYGVYWGGSLFGYVFGGWIEVGGLVGGRFEGLRGLVVERLRGW